MKREEILRLLLNQAQLNGFEFRQWFRDHMDASWAGMEQALALLARQSRHYSLLFSHEFARTFWRPGAVMRFSVPSVTYTRVNTRGDVIQVTRKPFTRRTIKHNVWKYHLRQMAVSEDPILYLCRFLPVDIETTSAGTTAQTFNTPVALPNPNVEHFSASSPTKDALGSFNWKAKIKR